MKGKSLEEVIRQYIPIPAMPTNQGWYRVLCRKCMDHGRKGKRAGFRFDGDVVGYHCFNCGANPKYDPHEQTKVSKQMEEVLTAFGVPPEELNAVMFKALQERGQSTDHVPESTLKLEPQEIELPYHFYKLGSKENDKYTELAEYYLEERGLDPYAYPYYLSDGGKEKWNQDWKARLIIPFYKNNKLIFYQGRDLLDSRTNKYKSVDVSRDNIFYGYDQITKYSQDPLYVLEGYFDANVVSGAASLSNELTEHQLEILRRSPRPKVIIPDRHGSGFVMANQAIQEGWSVSIPPDHDFDAKDISDAMKKYGKLYVLRIIKENIVSDFEAKTRIRLYLK